VSLQNVLRQRSHGSIPKRLAAPLRQDLQQRVARLRGHGISVGARSGSESAPPESIPGVLGKRGAARGRLAWLPTISSSGPMKIDMPSRTAANVWREAGWEEAPRSARHTRLSRSRPFVADGRRPGDQPLSKSCARVDGRASGATFMVALYHTPSAGGRAPILIPALRSFEDQGRGDYFLARRGPFG